MAAAGREILIKRGSERLSNSPGVGAAGSGTIGGIYLKNATRRFGILRVAGTRSAHKTPRPPADGEESSII